MSALQTNLPEISESEKEIYELFGIEAKTLIEPVDEVDKKIIEM